MVVAARCADGAGAAKDTAARVVSRRAAMRAGGHRRNVMGRHSSDQSGVPGEPLPRGPLAGSRTVQRGREQRGRAC